MWTVVFITCDKNAVDKIRHLFREHSVMLRVRTVSNGPECEGDCYKIMVPYSEVGIAQDIIIEEEIN